MLIGWRPTGKKKVRRTRADIERERQDLLAKTIREIDALVAEYHAKLPREDAKIIGALYARYTGEIVPGEFTKLKRPRRRIVIDPETCPWVQKMFHWFVTDRLSITEIARRLNDDPDAPIPTKSLTGYWTQQLARKYLALPVYRGFWVYGAAKSKWSSENDYAERECRPEPLQSGQFENLRTVLSG